jgi:hypothetical protein
METNQHNLTNQHNSGLLKPKGNEGLKHILQREEVREGSEVIWGRVFPGLERLGTGVKEEVEGFVVVVGFVLWWRMEVWWWASDCMLLLLVPVRAALLAMMSTVAGCLDVLVAARFTARLLECRCCSSQHRWQPSPRPRRLLIAPVLR